MSLLTGHVTSWSGANGFIRLDSGTEIAFSVKTLTPHQGTTVQKGDRVFVMVAADGSARRVRKTT